MPTSFWLEILNYFISYLSLCYSVVNLSNMVVKDSHISLLSKGLNFCPAPRAATTGELKIDLDKFHRSLRLKSYFNKDKQKKQPEITPSDQEIPTPATKPKRGRPRRTRSLLDVQCTAQPKNVGQTQSDIEAILDTSSVFDPGHLSKGFNARTSNYLTILGSLLKIHQKLW